jgi:hypothetical protein
VATGFGNAIPLETTRRLGLGRIDVVADLPVVSAVFGYSRRSADPTYKEENAAGDFATSIRPFPVLDQDAARSLGSALGENTVPILAREALHEGIALFLDPAAVIKWLQVQGVTLVGDSSEEQLATLLGLLEPVDRLYDNIWELPVRRLVWGLLHSVSHCALKALSRVAGIEATGLAEYLFVPLLGTVVYSTATMQLGGVHTVANHRLSEFLDTIREEAERCLYDPDCLHRESACHGCIHVPEIACRAFNHGLARSFLVGGRSPWVPAADQTRTVGFWEVTAPG